MDQNKIIKKGLKLYLLGKKNLNTNKKKSFEYLKKSIKYLNLYKDKNDLEKFKDIIEETENECNKLIIQTITENRKKKNLDHNINFFKIIAKGNIKKLRNLNISNINFNNYNKNGQTILHYCIRMGDTNILKLLLKNGGSIDQVNKNGNTLLEYSCLENDPNSIQFLIKHGSNMKKHLYFRNGKKFHLKKSDIDLAILLKIVLSYEKNKNNQDIDNNLMFLFNFIKEDILIGINDYDFKFFVKCLSNLLNSIDKVKSDTYIKIIRDEVSYHLKENIFCPINKIDLILSNLIPFIDYPFNVSINYIIRNEIKYLILKIFKNKKFILNLSLKKNILNKLWNTYIYTKLFQSDFIGILTSQVISEIKL